MKIINNQINRINEAFQILEGSPVKKSTLITGPYSDFPKVRRRHNNSHERQHTAGSSMQNE